MSPLSQSLTVVVLAAGKGTHMKSGKAKVLHPLAGRTLIGHVIATAGELSPEKAIAVLANGMDDVAAEVGRADIPTAIATQDPPLGTGHALMAARDSLPADGDVLVLYGDTPLLTAETLRQLLARRREVDAAVAVFGFRPPDPAGYGRLRFDGEGLAALVEERHADEDLKRDGLCNAGIMAMDAARLGTLLDCLEVKQPKGEYYLTDIVEHARARGWSCTAIEGPWEEGHGVNSQSQLAEAEAVVQRRLRQVAMDRGVTMPAPETVHLSADTELAPGVEVQPYVVFGPKVSVASGAVIKSFSHLEGAHVGKDGQIGPYARLRPGSEIGEGARIGNFVETKNTVLEAGAKANHLTYLVDAHIGAKSNIGAGTITCNYDGFYKYRTEIGQGVFIGSNSALVAPVSIDSGAMVGAGSTITDDVPTDALAIARGRQRNIEGGAASFRAGKSKSAA
ncbi:MAG: bifunctional UDP-N-acetylglucosamine diphosphorylase/glucosamine-1-phosphate N-acetyltransferase GlmU [Geminicoccaceae bacterium]